MGFQSTVQLQQGFGVPGEMFTDSPWRAESFTLVSALASYNVIGATAYTKTSEGVAEAGAGGALGFAGILVDPKNQTLLGVGGNALAPTLVLPNQTQAELLTMGTIIVTLPAPAAIGDYLIYDDVTGALATMAPGGSLPSGKSFAFGLVDYFTVSGSGLAVVTISPTLVIPT